MKEVLLMEDIPLCVIHYQIYKECSCTSLQLSLCGLTAVIICYYILFTHQQIHFLLSLEKFKFTLK